MIRVVPFGGCDTALATPLYELQKMDGSDTPPHFKFQLGLAWTASSSSSSSCRIPNRLDQATRRHAIAVGA